MSRLDSLTLCFNPTDATEHDISLQVFSDKILPPRDYTRSLPATEAPDSRPLPCPRNSRAERGSEDLSE